MKPTRKHSASESYVLSESKLVEKLNNIISQGSFSFANGKRANAKELEAFLYKINFLTARKDTATLIIRRYFEESRYLSSTIADFGVDWKIHPAYRWALQPTAIDALFESISPVAE